jgi:hypothetical protein
MRASLVHALDGQRQAQVDLAVKSVLVKPKPLPKQPQAEQLARPHLAEARNLMAATQPVLEVHDTFASKVEGMGMFEIVPEFQQAFSDLTSRLDERMQEELLAVLDPVAEQVLKGQDVRVDSWPELDAIGRKYQESVALIEPYLKLYQDSRTQTPLLLQFTAGLLHKLKDPRRKRVREKLVTLKDVDFAGEMERWRDDVVEKIRAGEPFNPRQLKDPKTILESYKRKAVRVARQTR